MTTLIGFWRRMLPEWQFALSTFVITRLVLAIWSLTIYTMMPVALQNVELFGSQLLTVFNLETSERYVYLRQVDNEVLTFDILEPGYLTDKQTGSIWSMPTGRAVDGQYKGKYLTLLPEKNEAVFPYVGVPPSKHTAFALWQRFDSNWYLKIATHGYDGADGSTVYFPVYPMLIWALSFIFDPMLAGLLISNLAVIGVLVLLYKNFSTLADVASVKRSLAYLLAFPTSFFLMGAYTESLFLLFVLACFYSASRRQWTWSLLCGALAALTRLQGILLVLPLLYMLWRETRFGSLKKIVIAAWPLAIIPLSTFSFLAYSNLSLLNKLQDHWNAKFVLPWNSILAAVVAVGNGNGSLVDVLNLLITLFMIVMLFPVWKRLPFEYTLYSLAMLFVPMFRMSTTQPLVSTMRYVLAIFPVFLVLGVWGENRWVNRLILYSSVPLQLYLTAQFILWGWVA